MKMGINHKTPVPHCYLYSQDLIVAAFAMSWKLQKLLTLRYLDVRMYLFSHGVALRHSQKKKIRSLISGVEPMTEGAKEPLLQSVS